MSVPMRDFLKARHDRALATILGHAERTFYDRLSIEERQKFRTVVIEALNSYHEVTLDLLRSEDGLSNDAILEVLQRVDRHLRS